MNADHIDWTSAASLIGMAVDDVDRVARWVHEQHGMPMEPLPCDGVGYEVAGRMTAGLIWYPRKEGGAWCHIAITQPWTRFAAVAANRFFAAHNEAWFEIPLGNEPALSFVRRLGAKQPQDDSRADPGFALFSVRQKDIKWLPSRPH